MDKSYFERVTDRMAEEVAEDQDQDHPELMGQLVLAMRVIGMDPDDDANVADFVKLLKKVTTQKLKMGAHRLTTSKAAVAGKAARSASRE